MHNLEYKNKQEEYLKYQNKGSVIYSFVTLIVSLLSGLFFNINNYLPLIICMIICFINIILPNFIYDEKEESNENNKNIEKNNLKFNKKITLILVLYGLFYSSISIGQNNSKLFMQYNMSDFLSTEKIAIYLSIFLTISRVVRLMSDMFFIKIYDMLKDKILILLEIILILAFSFLLIGNYVGMNMIGIVIMSIGFCMFLAIRDPFDNYIRKILFNSCDSKYQDIAVINLQLSRKLGELLFSGIVALILTKYSYTYVMTILLIITLGYIKIIYDLYKILNKKVN